MLQDQEAHARAIAQYENQSQRPDDPRARSQQRRASQGGQPQQQPQQGQQGQGDGPDPMTEIQQQLKEGFEVGKKTFNSLFTKAKQKFAEFEQQRYGVLNIISSKVYSNARSGRSLSPDNRVHSSNLGAKMLLIIPPHRITRPR